MRTHAHMHTAGTHTITHKHTYTHIQLGRELAAAQQLEAVVETSGALHLPTSSFQAILQQHAPTHGEPSSREQQVGRIMLAI